VAQFQVYRLPGDLLVLDLQSDLIATATRIVAPLVPERAGPPAMTRLEPVLVIEGERYALHTGELAAIRGHLLKGLPVADLTAEDYAIRGALDMLFSGF
jgi:toxin CcdB